MKKSFLAIAAFMVCAIAPIAETMRAADAPRQEVALNEPAISGRRGAIDISCPSNGKAYTFQIYSITGQLIKRVQLTDSATSVDVPQGCYIVKCEAWVKKVIVL